MSVSALTWSFKLPLRDMAAKAVLHALADHADDAGRCWPSIDRVARWAGCNDKTARKAMQRLAELGVISRVHRAGTSDMFTLNYDWHPSQIRDLPDQGPPKDGPSLKRPEPLPDQGGGGSQIREDTPPKIGTRTTKEPSRNRQSTTKGKAADGKFKLTAEYQLDADGWAYAQDRGIDATLAFRKFVDHFTNGRGKSEQRTADGWLSRWKIWVDTDAKWSGTVGTRPARAVQPPRGNEAFYDELAVISDRSRSGAGPDREGRPVDAIEASIPDEAWHAPR